MNDPDVIVAGGGPGGSACAVALARGDRRVVLLEAEPAARDHVGESLSPTAWQAVLRLGAASAMRGAGFCPKLGATFSWSGQASPWTVSYPMVDDQPPAYQARRAKFDAMLLAAASAAGADVRLGWRVEQILPPSNGTASVLATSPFGESVRLAAPWVVDARGRSWPSRSRHVYEAGPAELDNAALWGYWRRRTGSPPDSRHTSLLVGRPEYCLWYYPLDEMASLASVGVVISATAHDDPVGAAEKLYLAAVDSCPELESVLSGTVLEGPVRSCAADAWACEQMAGDGWFLVGDAAFFVDPLLTPGVQLAIEHGTLAAACLLTLLNRREDQASVLGLYDEVIRRDYDTYIRLSTNLYRAARTSSGPVGGQAQVPAADGQFAFLSLISGLPRSELAARLGEYISLRNAVAERGGAAVALGEKEGFSFLRWLFHKDRLIAERSARIVSRLADDCVLRPAVGAAIGNEPFLSADGDQVLTFRPAVRNRLGDRFAATPEIEALFAVLGKGRSFAETRRRFRQTAPDPGAGCSPEFDTWIELLADHALVEWALAGEGDVCVA